MILAAQSVGVLAGEAWSWRHQKLGSFPPHTQPATKRQLFCITTPHKHKAAVCGSSSRDPKESVFFDENGAVEDMDGYLNYLSLEYDSVWDTKPSWCQPWTITLTGVLILTLSWLALHSVLISSIALTLVCAWWYIFLYAYPKEYADMIAARRKKVVDGLEDTYGSARGQ